MSAETALAPPTPLPPASVKDDGGKGTSFIRNLLRPLLTQPHGGQSSSDAPLDEASASPSGPQTFGDVNLDTGDLVRVHSLMMAALKR